MSKNQPILSFPPAYPLAIEVWNAFWQAGVFQTVRKCLCSYPNSCLGTHLLKKLCFDSSCNKFYSRSSIQFSSLHQEYVNRQNCIFNTEVIRQVHSLKDLRQKGSPQTPKKGYETEFHVQERSQTGVWERAGNLCFRTVCSWRESTLKIDILKWVPDRNTPARRRLIKHILCASLPTGHRSAKCILAGRRAGTTSCEIS